MSLGKAIRYKCKRGQRDRSYRTSRDSNIPLSFEMIIYYWLKLASLQVPQHRPPKQKRILNVVRKTTRFWNSREENLALIDLSSSNKVSLVKFRSQLYAVVPFNLSNHDGKLKSHKKPQGAWLWHTVLYYIIIWLFKILYSDWLASGP
jgi:hypothetical protein